MDQRVIDELQNRYGSTSYRIEAEVVQKSGRIPAEFWKRFLARELGQETRTLHNPEIPTDFHRDSTEIPTDFR